MDSLVGFQPYVGCQILAHIVSIICLPLALSESLQSQLNAIGIMHLSLISKANRVIGLLYCITIGCIGLLYYLWSVPKGE